MGLKNGAAGYDEITAVTLQLVSLHIIEPINVYLQYIIESGNISYWDETSQCYSTIQGQ